VEARCETPQRAFQFVEAAGEALMSNAGKETRRGIAIPKWLWDAERRPDTSREGFEAAFRAAIEFCSAYEYATIAGLQDDINMVMSDRLRTPEIEVTFIAWHWSTRRPRIEVRAGRHTAREDIAVKFSPSPGAIN